MKYLEFNLSKISKFFDDNEINKLATEQFGKCVKEIIRGKTNLLSKYVKIGCDETSLEEPEDVSQ